MKHTTPPESFTVLLTDATTAPQLTTRRDFPRLAAALACAEAYCKRSERFFAEVWLGEQRQLWCSVDGRALDENLYGGPIAPGSYTFEQAAPHWHLACARPILRPGRDIHRTQLRQEQPGNPLQIPGLPQRLLTRPKRIQLRQVPLLA